MKVLVTGGAGFIGSYVCEALLKNEHQVRILDNLDPQVHGRGQNWPTYLPSNIERVLGDVRDHDKVAEALKDCDAVIHLAAAVGVGQSMYEIEHYTSVNVLGTAIFLEEVIKQKDHIKKLIVAGSMSSYGEGAYVDIDQNVLYPPIRSNDQLSAYNWELIDENGNLLKPIPTNEQKTMHPQSIYSVNKKDQEEMAIVVGRAYNIPTTVFRMFNVYGPRQALSNPYTGVVAIFSSRLLNGQPPIIFEDGQQKRDLVYVEDVARAYVMALESTANDFQILNLGGGVGMSILDIAMTLSKVLNIKIDPVITKKFRSGDIRHCFADISQIEKNLNWTPKWTFQDGIKKLTNWLKSQSSVDLGTKAKIELIDKGLLR